MNIIFYGLLAVYLLLTIVRLALANQYQKRIGEPVSQFAETKYTVVQPILSGDVGLKEDLVANLESSKDLQFLWLIDQSDSVARKTAEEICRNHQYAERIRIVLCEDVPQNVNPKIYKIEKAIEKITTPYIIVLDDDSVIDMAAMGELNAYENVGEELLITGIPHNYGTLGFWSKLLAAFVNGNSLISYFTMAQIGENHSINGMFYILSLEMVRKYRAFAEIKNYLCDDLALAEYLTSCGVKIVQSRIGVNVRTTMDGGRHYYRQMYRWMLFSSIYLKRHLSLWSIVLILVSGILPFLLFVASLFLGGREILSVIGVLAVKGVVLYAFRRRVIGKAESIDVILYEMISDIILTPLFGVAIVKKPVIVWRNKKIRVTDGKIHYE